jgi:hypothetical protein
VILFDLKLVFDFFSFFGLLFTLACRNRLQKYSGYQSTDYKDSVITCQDQNKKCANKVGYLSKSPLGGCAG